MFVKTSNNTLVVKFKHYAYEMTREIRFKKRPAELHWEHNETIAMVRLLQDSPKDYVYVKAECNDNDQFKKYVGRELALIKLLKFVILDEEARKAVIAEYNRVYKKHPVDEAKINYILTHPTSEIVTKVEEPKDESKEENKQ